jgi:hypothetical protein
MNAAQAVVLGLSLVIILVIAAVFAWVRRRAVRKSNRATEAEAWASFGRRIERVLRERDETPEDQYRREVPDLAPGRLAWRSRTHGTVWAAGAHFGGWAGGGHSGCGGGAGCGGGGCGGGGC